jgi:hypothetical protein
MLKNQNGISKERFKDLIEHAQALLNMSPHELKDKYNELIRRIDKGFTEHAIDVRLNEEKITICCLVDKQKRCTDAYFFFDRIEDEDAFIDYLIDHADYSFRKRVWSVFDCNIRTKEIKDILTFHFYKQSEISQIEAKYLFSFFKRKVNVP